MRRRRFVSIMVGGIASLPATALAQGAKRVPRVGILWHAGSPEGEGVLYESLHQGFRDLGYIPGQNLIVVERFPGEAAGKFELFANELAGLDLDILVAVSVPSVLAAQKLATTLPVVFLPIVDPVALRLVASLARPGGNMTGLSTMGVDIAAKRVQFLKEILPRASKIALLFDPVVPYNIVREISESKTAAQQMQIEVNEFKAHEADELGSAFEAIHRGGQDAIILAQGPMFFLEQARISQLALEQRIPIMGPAEAFAGPGFLASYGANWPSIFRRAAVYVDKILKGAKPADLPVEQPTRFDFVVNLKAAKTFGIEVPPLVLARADKIIE
jgi:putative tryptophan/tyrosine transport system substrate-binding protein